MASQDVYILAKGPRVLNRKEKEGSTLALYRPGQGIFLHFFQTLILGFWVFGGVKLGKIGEIGVGRNMGKYHIMQHGTTHHRL